MISHIEAKRLVDALPTVQKAPDPERLSLLTRAVSMVEAQYGAGWLNGDTGYGSNNWGAITGTYQGSYFEHGDSKPVTQPDGSIKQVSYTTKFRKYPTMVEGAEDLARLLQSKYSAAVDAVPDWQEVARNLYGYYLGTGTKENAIANYARLLDLRANQIAGSTGEVLPKVLPAPAVASAPPRGAGSSFSFPRLLPLEYGPPLARRDDEPEPKPARTWIQRLLDRLMGLR